MKLAITGATGFIGQHLVDQALLQSHDVVAITRHKNRALPTDHPRLTIARMNLMQPGRKLAELINDCDAVIHLAATMRGADQYQETLKTTKKLLSSMDQANCKRLVLISSISVLDYVSLKPYSSISETTSLCENDVLMGDYARMKRDQEKLCREWRTDKKELVIIRLGLVYDDTVLSDAHAGFIKKGIGLVVKHQGEVPLVSVKLAARQILFAATNREFSDHLFHLLNKSATKQKDYIKQLKLRYNYRLLLPLPWQWYSFIAKLIRGLFILLNKKSRIPDSFRANSVAARQKPFLFDTNKIIGY